tara:strand:- start:356 stop:676 length:321 start_codon:yes stop_codon:yes gene_type:complete
MKLSNTPFTDLMRWWLKLYKKYRMIFVIIFTSYVWIQFFLNWDWNKNVILFFGLFVFMWWYVIVGGDKISWDIDSEIYEAKKQAILKEESLRQEYASLKETSKNDN